MKPQASNTPALRFSEFDDEWNGFKLGDIAHFRRGSFPQPYGLEKWYDDESGLPFVQVFDVGKDFKLKSTTKRMISEEAQAFSVFVSKGTLVLTLQGSIGRLAITQYDAFVDRTLLIFESFSLSMNMYFFMYSVFLLFQKEKQKAPGGTIKTITKEVLTDFRIFLPSIAEQNKIGSLLQSVDENIAHLTTKKDLLLEYKKGVMRQIVDQKIRFKDGNGNNYPDWEEKRLSEFAEVSAGATPSTLKPEYWGGDIRWMNSGELNLKRVYDVENRISKLGLKKSSTRLLPKHCVLIGLAGQGKTRGTVA
ncbi:MAG: restriction endonuclease subunit S [Pyrinomonadaceae bacterium]